MTDAALNELIGITAYDIRGEKIGKVKQIYIANSTGAATWAAVSTGLFSGDSLVPLAGAEHRARAATLQLKVDKEQVKTAPQRDEDGGISPHTERELFAHYGIDPTFAGWNTDSGQQIRPGGDEPLTYGNLPGDD